MALETAQYIDSLVDTNPAGLDSRTTADDHLRLIKAALKRTFTGITGAVTGTHTTLNRTNDLTSSAQLQLNSLKDDKADKTGTAQYADSANSAASAVFAFSATNATSAVFATSASNAASAGFAFSSNHAASAVGAQSAVFATSATRCTSAVFAYSASRCTSAVFARVISGAGITTGTIPAARIDNASAGGDGLVEFANTAEYQAGTDYTRAIPIGMFKASGLTNITTTPYKITLAGGITIQMGLSGSMASGAAVADSFDTNFTTVLGYTAVAVASTPTSTTGANLYVTSVTTSSISFKNMAANTCQASWIVIGIV